MAKLTPEEAAQKQAARLKASTEDIRRGIDRVTAAPTAKAAQKIDKMKANLVAAIDSGRVAKALQSVSLDEWKSKARDIGVNRIAAGIDAVADKQRQFYSKLLPAVDSARAKIASMPDTTLEDSINRMTAYIREMAKFKKV
jgi:hypothetical protein